SHAAMKLVSALETPFEVAGERLHVAASIGIALFPDQGEDVDTLLRRADIAMYVAKRGDSDFAVYSPDQDEHSPSRLALMGDLRPPVSRMARPGPAPDRRHQPFDAHAPRPRAAGLRRPHPQAAGAGGVRDPGRDHREHVDG